MIGLLLAGTGVKAQTVQCSNRAKDCPRKQDIETALAQLPGLSDWVVISVTNHQMWKQFCEFKCDIPAFTYLANNRTYLDTEKIWAKSGPAGLREYLAHELGHILTGSKDERVAERKGQDLLQHRR